MSFDLDIVDIRLSRFVPEACVHYAEEHFGFWLRFPEGYDATTDAGWLPLQVKFAEAGDWTDTGFEVHPRVEDEVLSLSVPAGGDRFGPAVACVFARYCRAVGATVEDPYTGSIYGPRTEEALDRRVFDLFLDPGGVDLQTPMLVERIDEIQVKYQRLVTESRAFRRSLEENPDQANSEQAAERASSIRWDARFLFEDAFAVAREAADAGFDLHTEGSGPLFWLEKLCTSLPEWFIPGSEEMIGERLWWAERFTEAETDALLGETRVIWNESRLRELVGRELMARGDVNGAFDEFQRAYVLETILRDDQNFGGAASRRDEVTELFRAAAVQLGRPQDWDPAAESRVQSMLGRARDTMVIEVSPDELATNPNAYRWAKQLKRGLNAIGDRHYHDAEAILDPLVDEIANCGRVESDLGRRATAALQRSKRQEHSEVKARKRGDHLYQTLKWIIIVLAVIALAGWLFETFG